MSEDVYGKFTSDVIYEQLKAAGVEIDHHESDLYVKATPQSTEILKGYQFFKSNVSIFRSQIDNSLWYDVPFAYNPFWERKQEIARRVNDVRNSQDKPME